MRHLTAMLIGAQLHTDNDVWHSGSGNGNNNCNSNSSNKNKNSIKVRDDIGLGRRFALMRINMKSCVKINNSTIKT